jgi:hypothetical protein
MSGFILGSCFHGVDLDRDFCPHGCVRKATDAAKILRLAQALRLLRDTGTEYAWRVSTAALEAAGIPDPPEEDQP